jgi:hypothetical protein
MKEALDAVREMSRPSETVLDCPRDSAKLAATTREWAESNEAEQVRAVLSSEHVWVRLESASMVGHLLFRLIQPDVIA